MRRRGTPPPDPGHGCADPARCRRPFCAVPADVRLVAPDTIRVVVGDLPGWPVSASALLDHLGAGIDRTRLLRIADSDPFGAHRHFPILVRVRLSGRVPPRLEFHPGEALRLHRWRSGDGVDHLARAWCCALLAVAPGDWSDGLVDVAAPLVASCLALGGDAPELAERLFAWRAVSAPADPPADAPADAPAGPAHGAGPHRADPVALLALLLLRAATNAADPRLDGLARTAADALAAPPADPAASTPMASTSASRWRHLVDGILSPLRPTHPEIGRLVDAL